MKFNLLWAFSFVGDSGQSRTKTSESSHFESCETILATQLSYPTNNESLASIWEVEKSVDSTPMEFKPPNCTAIIITFVSAAISAQVVRFLT